MRQKAPAGFGGRLRGKGRNSQHVNPGPRRAAHPVHESPESSRPYLHADLQLKQRALDRTAPPHTTPGRYTPPDTLLAFLESL